MTLPTPYLWITTRDGSPTLWSNALSEPFRSTKGAFSESWAAFVGPAIEHAVGLQDTSSPRRVVGEFGLGPGTNWLLWTLASEAHGIDSGYFAIEKDTSSFRMGLDRWLREPEAVAEFLGARGISVSTELLPRQLAEAAYRLRVYADFETARAELGSSLDQADLWFHDPFGFEVNAEGYSAATLKDCRGLWSERGLGLSYACNRHFQSALAEAVPSARIRIVPTGAAGLKRERMEWQWNP